MPKEVFLPIGELPKWASCYFLYSGNTTHNSWRLKRAYPAQFKAERASQREIANWGVRQ
jgi:hypothetical protein